MKAKIYQPAKSATQSAKNDFWLFEFNSQDKPIIDDKMLWTSSSNTQDKVKIKFSDKDKAIKFAEKNNIDFIVIEPKQRKIKPKSYADNFSQIEKHHGHIKIVMNALETILLRKSIPLMEEPKPNKQQQLKNL